MKKAALNMVYRFLVGSYTKNEGHVPDARGDGISVLEFDGELETCRTLSIASNVINPTYLALDAEASIVYSIVEESSDNNAVDSWRLRNNGTLSLQSGNNTRGWSGCHLSIIPDKNRLFAASYNNGVLSEYKINKGEISPLINEIIYEGSGPDIIRQDAPHAHQVIPDSSGKYIYVCDLGTDMVWMHQLDSMKEAPAIALKAPAGYGPRHLAFDPESNIAYVLCELTPKLLLVTVDPISGKMEITQELDTVSQCRMMEAAPAAVKIHPSGHTIAVSNRFDDTISVFEINRTADITLSLIDNFSCRGKTPRDITFSRDGEMLFIANQDSHDIQCRHFISSTGLPGVGWSPKIDIGSPVCIVMA